jgi:hypothetical protein
VKPSSFIILHAFLKKLDPEYQAKLIQYLPEGSQQKLDELSSFPPAEINYERFQFEWLLDYVHYSWLLPAIKAHSKESVFFLECLRSNGGKKFAAKMKIPASGKSLSKLAKKFFRKTLIDSLIGEKSDLLPWECLPESELNILCKFTKQELVELIGFLSLYDLAAEIRQIVETKILKKIYSLLSEAQKKFIKTVMMQKEHISIAKLGLDRWDGTEESFHALLHRRGLTRLAIALAPQHPDLVWYVTHLLDVGRGSTLKKSRPKEVSSQIAATITQNIMELVPLVHRS